MVEQVPFLKQKLSECLTTAPAMAVEGQLLKKHTLAMEQFVPQRQSLPCLQSVVADLPRFRSSLRATVVAPLFTAFFKSLVATWEIVKSQLVSHPSDARMMMQILSEASNLFPLETSVNDMIQACGACLKSVSQQAVMQEVHGVIDACLKVKEQVGAGAAAVWREEIAKVTSKLQEVKLPRDDWEVAETREKMQSLLDLLLAAAAPLLVSERPEPELLKAVVACTAAMWQTRPNQDLQISYNQLKGGSAILDAQVKMFAMKGSEQSELVKCAVELQRALLGKDLAIEPCHETGKKLAWHVNKIVAEARSQFDEVAKALCAASTSELQAALKDVKMDDGDRAIGAAWLVGFEGVQFPELQSHAAKTLLTLDGIPGKSIALSQA